MNAFRVLTAALVPAALLAAGCATPHQKRLAEIQDESQLDVCFVHDGTASGAGSANRMMELAIWAGKGKKALFRSADARTSLQDSAGCDVMLVPETRALAYATRPAALYAARSGKLLGKFSGHIAEGRNGFVQQIARSLAPDQPMYADVFATTGRRAAASAASSPAAQASAVSREELRQLMAEAVKAAAKAPEAAEPSSASSDVDAPRYKRAEDPSRYAVVVGVEKYAGLPDASYAERDAKAVSEHLVALGWPRRNIALLTGAQATRTGLVKNLEAWLPQNAGEDATVFFYYSGHGAPDPQAGTAYLVPSDGDPQYLEETGYPVKRLYEKLGALKAKRVLVAMDACFSGAGGRSVLPKGMRPLVGKIDTGAVGGKVVALTASAANQVSGAYEAQSHGLFTYYLLKGLNGDAADGAGRVTVGSLHRYLAPKVMDEAKRANRDQAPQLLPAAPAEDFPLR